MQLARGALHRLLRQADTLAQTKVTLLLEALDNVTDDPSPLFGGGRISRSAAARLLTGDPSYSALVRERLPYASAGELSSLRRLLLGAVPESAELPQSVGSVPSLPFPQAEAQGSWTGQRGS